MAVSQSMKRAVRRIADALGVYARRRGWWPLDFRLYFRVNEAWGRISVDFFAYEFEGKGTFENYQSVMDYLQTRLADDPELLNALGLVVSSFKNLEGRGLHAIESQSRLVKPRDLLKVAMREVAGLIDKYARDSGWDQKGYSLFRRANHEQDEVHIVLVAPATGDEAAVRELVRSRLADDPEVLKSFKLTYRVRNDSEPDWRRQLLDAGYKDFWALSRV